MERLTERLHDAALAPSVELDWDRTVRVATRRRRVRAAGITAGVLVVAFVAGVGGLLLLDDDADRGTVIVTQPPATDSPTTQPPSTAPPTTTGPAAAESLVHLEGGWVVAVPNGYESVGLQSEGAESRVDDEPTTTTARFRAESGGELLLRQQTGLGVPPLGRTWFEADGVETREIEFLDAPGKQAGYRPAGAVDQYQHLGWRVGEYLTFEVLFSESLSITDAEVFAAAIRQVLDEDVNVVCPGNLC